jgi:cation:H+ antiporter
VDRLGARLGLAAGLFGVVTALAANAPELSAAVTALVGGHPDVGLGVVFGSNVFNLAAVLGLSAVAGGGVWIGHRRLLLDGVVAVLVLAITAALIFGHVGPRLATLLAMAVFLPYVVVLGLRPATIRRLVPAGRVLAFLNSAVLPEPGAQPGEAVRVPGTGIQLRWIAPALVAIVLASVGMVRSSIVLASHWGVRSNVVGMVVLAGLTGIPNVIAAVRLALRQRGAAVVSEALNSNTLNLLAGVCLPAVLLGTPVPDGLTVVAVWWLLGMTVVALALTASHRHLSRRGGACLLGLFVVFVGVVLLW